MSKSDLSDCNRNQVEGKMLTPYSSILKSNVQRLCLGFISGYAIRVLLAAHYFLLLFFYPVSAVSLRYKLIAAIHPYQYLTPSLLAELLDLLMAMA